MAPCYVNLGTRWLIGHRSGKYRMMVITTNGTYSWSSAATLYHGNHDKDQWYARDMRSCFEEIHDIHVQVVLCCVVFKR